MATVINASEEATASHQTATENSDEQAIVSSIKGKLCGYCPLPKTCGIFRVPDVLRRNNNKAFVPEVVSIGPFHHGQKKLQAMEKIKLWYLHDLLNRKRKEETSLERFVNVIGSMEQDCRESYAEEIHFSRKEFVEIMVVDGCFIIEFFRKAATLVSIDTTTVPKKTDDPVFNTSWMKSQIATELLMLENQLPWRVLDTLFNMTDDDPGRNSLSKLAAYTCYESGLSMALEPDEDPTNMHLLHFLRNCLLGPYGGGNPKIATSWFEHIPSVTELLQAGVKFKKGNENDIRRITFVDGVMEIPPIRIKDNTEFVFKNLIAFEQCEPDGLNIITAYAVLLDNLINNSEDVEFLIEKKILQISNSMSTQETASFFNRLSSNVTFSHFLYMDLYGQVNTHYRGRWNKWQATLQRKYFNNPWSYVSFGAAIIILALTFLQTFYAIYSYYHPRK